MVVQLPPGALTSQAAASTDFDIPAPECCFTGCCDRGKAFLLEQLDKQPDQQLDEDDSHEHYSPHP
ncbi:hypothetical protein [Arthrobacter sp. B0490]|uniref:hypothetical protein n=1 Tax=Arthrobacter sp. B0490 TaxID=2058891 RepID=UPI000CE32736|nr:hypothetical protein [Arthrobacter sp. B0490]